MLDPIAQAFRIDVPVGIPGIFATKLNLYFSSKSYVGNGVSVYICEMENGYPNTSKVLPFSNAYLPAVEVNTSSTSTTSTTFTFEAPVYLANQREYAFIVKPDGNDPDYRLWIAELGGSDTISGNQIYSPPFASTLFYSYTYSTWTAVQTQYVKFDLYRANFDTAGGYAMLSNDRNDYFVIANVAYANSSVGVRTGDLVLGSTNNTVSTSNSQISGTIIYSNMSGGYLAIANSTGVFANISGNVNFIQIHRPVSESNLTYTNTTLIATANLVSIRNIAVNSLAPRIAELRPPGTYIGYSYYGTNNSATIDTDSKVVNNETEVDMDDYERYIYSYSNENYNSMAGKSLKIKVNMQSYSSYVSPVIDLVRTKALAIQNLVTPTTANVYNEQFNSGTSSTKYVSKPIILASGQDAEDLKIYVSAFRPVGTDVLVYVKFHNASDPDILLNKNWTLMNNDSSNLRSNPKSPLNYVEYTYSVPTVNALPTTAYFNSTGAVLKTGSNNAAVSISNTSAVVTGTSNSLFTTEFRTDNTIRVNGESRKVITISNNTSLTVDYPFSSVLSAQSYFLVSNSGLTYTDSAGTTYVSFKTFSIKVVLLADSGSLVPVVDDIRAIALQV
jgi:hypothetical protein